MEIDPRYVDTAIRRWMDYRGKDAVHAETGETFSEIEETQAMAAGTEKDREEAADAR